MTREEFQVLLGELARLRETLRPEFEAWYDMANLTDVHDYCLTGWLLYRLTTNC